MFREQYEYFPLLHLQLLALFKMFVFWAFACSVQHLFLEEGGKEIEILMLSGLSLKAHTCSYFYIAKTLTLLSAVQLQTLFKVKRLDRK